MQVSLKAMRIHAGMNQKEAAELIEVSASTLAKWEDKKVYPDAEQLIRLCKVYGCSIDDISIL